MKKQRYLLVVAGPTASGKTTLAIRLAQAFQTVILSADSRQFYREMHIGTAKPRPEELAQAPHYFIDSHRIEESFSVGQYERVALRLLETLFQQQDTVVLAGGSGLYIQALCQGLDAFPPIPEGIRQQLQVQYEQEGLASLQAELEEKDPEYYQQVDLQNPQRLMRALEVCRATGQSFSSFRQQQRVQRDFTPIYLLPHWPRSQLYQRIDQRVDQMMEAGLLEEVRGLVPQQHLNALQTVGYQELFAHLAGQYSLDEAVALIKRNSRRYAKRQLTWNRRLGRGKRFGQTEVALVYQYLEWVKDSGKQVAWQRFQERSEVVFGWRADEVFRPVLTLQIRKKELQIQLHTQAAVPVAALFQFFLLHEIQCQFPALNLQAKLPTSWQATLHALNFKLEADTWIYTVSPA